MPLAAAPDVAGVTPPQRCAVHQSRPAVDYCPVCARPRCAVDAAGDRAGCAVCGGQELGEPRRPPLNAAAVLGASVLAHLTGVASGFVGQEYVEVKYFSILVPAGVGILCAIAAERGAGRARGLGVRLVAVAAALLSTALAFRLEGSVGLLSPALTVGPPYLAAAAGAWLWTQPPSAKARARSAE